MRSLTILFAVSTLTLLGGCASFNSVVDAPAPPALPSCHALGLPVKAPPIADDSDAIADLADHRAALARANSRIVKRDACEVNARKAAQ